MSGGRKAFSIARNRDASCLARSFCKRRLRRPAIRAFAIAHATTATAKIVPIGIAIVSNALFASSKSLATEGFFYH
jgi:hypothetical protein